MPASTALLGINGVTLRSLRKPGAGEVLALLRRKVDTQPLLPLLESTVGEIFADLALRVSRAIVG